MKNNLTKKDAKKLKSMLLNVGFNVPDEVKKVLGDEAEQELLCEKCGCPIHPCIACEEIIETYNNVDSTYLDLVEKILEEGKTKKNRTGIDTIGIFGEQAKYDINLNAFPILTTKKVWFKGIVHELLWFIKGDTNIKYLVDNDVHIWDSWAYKRYKKEFDLRKNPESIQQPLTQDEFVAKIKACPPYNKDVSNWEEARFAIEWGELGEGTYGGMWRNFPYHYEYDDESDGSDCGSSTYKHGGVDQLKKVIDTLQTNPDDRRMIVSAWHPYWVDHCALPPCHCLFHFNTEELTLEERKYLLHEFHFPRSMYPNKEYKGNGTESECDFYKIPTRRLNCLLYQRSCDFPVGIPYNITSYSLLTAMIAQCVGMIPGVLTHTYGDAHIYVNQIKGIKEQLNRTPMKLPKLWLNPVVKSLFDFKYEDINLIDYHPHPTIKFEVAV